MLEVKCFFIHGKNFELSLEKTVEGEEEANPVEHWTSVLTTVEEVGLKDPILNSEEEEHTFDWKRNLPRFSASPCTFGLSPSAAVSAPPSNSTGTVSHRHQVEEERAALGWGSVGSDQLMGQHQGEEKQLPSFGSG